MIMSYWTITPWKSAVDFCYTPFNAARIVKMPCGGSVKEWKQAWMFLRFVPTSFGMHLAQQDVQY